MGAFVPEWMCDATWHSSHIQLSVQVVFSFTPHHEQEKV